MEQWREVPSSENVQDGLALRRYVVLQRVTSRFNGFQLRLGEAHRPRTSIPRIPWVSNERYAIKASGEIITTRPALNAINMSRIQAT